MFLSTIQLMSFNTDYDKAPYAKIQLNLLKDGESRLNCSL
jgi:hypothetical protein